MPLGQKLALRGKALAPIALAVHPPQIPDIDMHPGSMEDVKLTRGALPLPNRAFVPPRAT